MSEIIGKIGAKGELYLPIKIRNKLGLEPNIRIKFIVTPSGDLIIRRIMSLKEIMKQPHLNKINIENVEKLSEEMQEKGMADS